IYYANNYLRSRQVVSIPRHSLLHCRDICSTNSTKQARQLIAAFSREFIPTLTSHPLLSYTPSRRMKPPCSMAIISPIRTFPAASFLVVHWRIIRSAWNTVHTLALWIITAISHYRRLPTFPLGSKLIGIISIFYPYYSSVESDDHNSDSTCSELLGGKVQ
ncbi:hypothetical protein EV363DRAFT_1167428, partial [Boletus edulis]